MEWLFKLLGELGSYFLATFIKDQQKRADMAASWDLWLKNRQSRADATVELKQNVEDQSDDLDRIQKELEQKAKEGTNGKSSKPSAEVHRSSGNSGTKR